MGEQRHGQLRVRSRGGHVPLRVIRRPWPHPATDALRDPDEVWMFTLGLPFIDIEGDSAGGLLLRGGGLARALVGEVSIPKVQIARACHARAKARHYWYESVAVQTVSGETFVLELSGPDIEHALSYLAEAGVQVEPAPWVWSLRFGGVTLEPQAIGPN